MQVEEPALFSRYHCRKNSKTTTYCNLTAVTCFFIQEKHNLKSDLTTSKDGYFLQCVLCLYCPLVHIIPRFHRAHLKHIRLLERCQGPAMRDKPVCLMLCGGRLVAPLSHPRPQETLCSLIRTRTRCPRSQAPADIPPASCRLNARCIYTARLTMWLNLPSWTFSISMLGALSCLSASSKPTSSHLTHILNYRTDLNPAF